MIRILVPLFSILLLFVNCDCTKAVNENNGKSILSLLNGHYIIVSMNDQNMENRSLTMNFDKSTNSISGYAGCNNYFGSYLQDDKSITFSKVSSTKKLCQDSEIRKLEEQLLTILPRINSMDSNKSGSINFYNDQSKLLLSITILN